jgi:copper chaperone CopZ
MTKKIFKISDMHCTSCALMIEADLEDAGMKAHASYAKGEVEVVFDGKKTKVEEIVGIVKKSGYTATEEA